MRLPIGRLVTCNLKLFDAESSMAKWTNPFRLWTAEHDHVAPGSSCNRHDEVPETSAATAALIADDDNKQGSSDQPHAESGEGEEHVMQKEWWRGPKLFEKFGGLRIVRDENKLKAQNYPSAQQKLGQKVKPVLHCYFRLLLIVPSCTMLANIALG
jgi:hypothetical protein